MGTITVSPHKSALPLILSLINNVKIAPNEMTMTQAAIGYRHSVTLNSSNSCLAREINPTPVTSRPMAKVA